MVSPPTLHLPKREATSPKGKFHVRKVKDAVGKGGVRVGVGEAASCKNNQIKLGCYSDHIKRLEKKGRGPGTL